MQSLPQWACECPLRPREHACSTGVWQLEFSMTLRTRGDLSQKRLERLTFGTPTEFWNIRQRAQAVHESKTFNRFGLRFDVDPTHCFLVSWSIYLVNCVESEEVIPLFRALENTD